MLTMLTVKQYVKKLLPTWLLTAREEHIKNRQARAFREMSSPREIFTKIYKENVWGKSTHPKQRFYSGNGSHNPKVVGVYVEAISLFLSSLGRKPDVVDLGCGDFHVGSKIRHLCGNYIACDIVEPVISWGRKEFGNYHVDFRLLDATQDPLPPGEVLFVRQVFQHLSNAQICQIVPKISSGYKYLVLTENLPASDTFECNLDKPSGPDIRAQFQSGVVLTAPPFNLAVQEATTLCDYFESDTTGVIRTILYRLA